MATPRFNLKSSDKPQSLVVMIYRLHNQRSVISTGLSVQTALWNKNRMRLSERGGNIDAINTNRVLNHFEQMTRECESALLAQHGSFHHPDNPRNVRLLH